MPEVTIEQPITLDLIPQNEPALSARSDIPVIETKPDSQPAPKEEVKPEVKAKDVDAVPPKEGEKPEDSATPEEPEDPPENAAEAGKPKSKGVQKRIDELVKQREEEKAEKLRLMALLEQLHKPKEEPKEVVEDEAPQRPTRESFENPADYEAALADYADQKAAWSAKTAVRDALAEEARKREQQAIEESQKAVRESYASRVEKAVEKYPDYKSVAESPDVTVSIAMAQAILHSENGPELAYHFGKNPAEAKRISSLNPVLQLVELGRIEAKLTAPVQKEDSPPPPSPKPVSKAPDPIKPLKTGSEQLKKSPDEESMEEYAARRSKELAAERGRPGVRR
jgi:hypothetical protein